MLARKAGLNAAAVIAAICIAWFAVSVSGEGKSIRLCFSRRLPGRGSWREELCWHPPRSAASACLIPCWELPCAGNGLSRSQLTFVISWPVWGSARSSHRSSWSGTHGAIRVGSQCFRPARGAFARRRRSCVGHPGPATPQRGLTAAAWHSRRQGVGADPVDSAARGVSVQTLPAPFADRALRVRLRIPQARVGALDPALAPL